MNENTIEVPVELTAGEMLRNARTTGRRKREISTIAKQLCIREEFLTALEDGNFAEIPETVYVLGFARNYAMELGLDPDVIVNKIKQEMGLESECIVSDAGADCAVESVGKKSIDMDAVKEFAVRAVKYVRTKWKWFAGGLVALILLIVTLTLVFGGDDVDAPVADENVPVVTTTVSEPKYAVNVRERFGVDNRASANIIIQAISESWVKIEDGRGNTVFSRVLVPGDVYYMPTGNKYKGTFGNAGGIDIWVDGKLAPKLGANQVRKSDVVMTAENLMSKK